MVKARLGIVVNASVFTVLSIIQAKEDVPLIVMWGV
jgi:hypothetical protein